MRARKPVLLSLCVSVLTLSSACTDAVAPRQELTQGLSTVVRAVMLAPAQVKLAAGEHVSMKATPTDANGKAVTTTVSWSTSDSTIATVSPNGDVAAVAAGNAVITVQAAGVTATAPVTIVSPPASPPAVSISPREAVLTVGDSLQFSATRDSVVNAATTTGSITWGSSNSEVATVSPTGIVTAVSAGIASIRVTSAGVTAVATVTVTLPPPPPPVVVSVASVVLDSTAVTMAIGDEVQLGATARDAAGAVLDGRTITWSSSNQAVVTVSSTGHLTAVAAGSATVTAESEGQSAQAAITVVAAGVPDESGAGTGSSVLWANAPSYLTKLTAQSWSSIPSLGWDVYMNPNFTPKVSVVADPTAPLGDDHVLQFYYNDGFAGGSGPGLVSYDIHEDEVYIGFYWKLSPNFQAPNQRITKVFYVFQRNGDDRQSVVFAAYATGSSSYKLRLANEPDGSYWIDQNVKNITLYPGNWYKIELHLKRSSSDGAPDGLVEWWVDGQLAARYTNARLRDEVFSEVHIDPVWGGAGMDVKQHEDYVRYGRFYISGR